MGFCKYYKQKKIVSYDSGTTWQDVIPYVYQVGELYEIDSPDCSSGESLIRWTLVPGDYLCEGKDKYEKEIEEYSIDGVVWKAVYPTTYRKGRLLEIYSDICDNKWEGHYNDNTTYDPTVTPIECPAWHKWVPYVGCVYVDPIKFVRCSTSTSTTLTRGEVTYNPYYLIYGYIGDCVDTIGNGAFSGMTEISYMDIPSSVTIIGAWAFLECTSLSSITIPDSVTWIGDNAFAYCYDLSNVTIGSGVTTIGSGAFRYCSNLESIFVDSNNSVYDSRNNCNAIIETSTNKLITGSKNTIIPPTTTSIGNYAFARCNGLTSINIPDSVTSIGGYSFTYCSGLTSVTVNATTPPTLGIGAFDSTNNCPIYVPCESVAAYIGASGWTGYSERIQGIQQDGELRGIKFKATYSGGTTYSAECDSSTELTTATTRPSGYERSAMTDAVIGYCVAKIGQESFAYCSGLTSCTISCGVASIDISAFIYCYGLTSITMPNSVTTINNSAFSNCSGLTSVTLSNKIKTINYNAFGHCKSLTSITIPSTITYIGQYAFSSCSGLTSVTVNATTPPTLGSDAFKNTPIENGIGSIYVPAESVNTYKSASGWSAYASRIRALPFASKFKATYLGGATYSAECDSSSGLTTATTKPSGYQYTAMTDAVIGDCVTGMSSGVFEAFSSLSSCTFGENSQLSLISPGAFAVCSGLTSIIIPESVTSIGSQTFVLCSGLTSVTCLATNPPTLGSNVFYGTNDCPIYVPTNSVNTYKSASGWSTYASRIQPIP